MQVESRDTGVQGIASFLGRKKQITTEDTKG